MHPIRGIGCAIERLYTVYARDRKTKRCKTWTKDVFAKKKRVIFYAFSIFINFPNGDQYEDHTTYAHHCLYCIISDARNIIF